VSSAKPANHNFMKTKIVLLFAVATTVALLSQPMFATITYTYTGNPFFNASAPYTTSDMVTGSVELSSPLAANLGLTMVTPLAFSFSDGVQTITNSNALVSSVSFATGPTGAITVWNVDLLSPNGEIGTVGGGSLVTGDGGTIDNPFSAASNHDTPGTWTTVTPQVPDTGSTLSLMTLTLMALGVGARRLKWAAA
jgi:hypothetical protein